MVFFVLATALLGFYFAGERSLVTVLKRGITGEDTAPAAGPQPRPRRPTWLEAICTIATIALLAGLVDRPGIHWNRITAGTGLFLGVAAVLWARLAGERRFYVFGPCVAAAGVVLSIAIQNGDYGCLLIGLVAGSLCIVWGAVALICCTRIASHRAPLHLQ